MKVNLLSSFAAGVLLTTSICSAVYLSGDHKTTNATVKNVKVQLTETEMMDKLTAAGYIIEKKADDSKKKAETSKTASKPAASKPASTNTSSTEASKPAVTKVVVNVSEGMTSIDVGRVLQNAKLVDDPFKFSKIIEGRGLQNKLRPGQYTVDTGMTFNQIVETIFK